MKRILVGGLVLALGWLAASAAAGEVQWRPAARPAAEPPMTGPDPASVPGVALGSPIALAAVVDPQVTPVSFRPPWPGPVPPKVRAQSADAVLPLVSGPARPVYPQVTAYPQEPDGSWLPGANPAPALPLPVDTPVTPDCQAPPAGDGYVFPFDTASAAAAHFYGRAEFLLWWFRDSRLPPLVSTSPEASGGIIGQPGTVVLFGGSDVENEERAGGRFTAGFWLDPCQTWSLEGTYFFLGQRAVRFAANSDQFSTIARPFFNLNAGTEFSELTTSPSLGTGSISVVMPSRLWGAEASLRRTLCGCPGGVSLLGGFRYLDLGEGLSILEDVQAFPDVPLFGGNHIFVADNFATRNQFYGGQLGAAAELRRGRWSVDLQGKIALGVNRQTININGSQLFIAPTGVQTPFTGGLLALPTNSGHFERDRFAVVPEIGVNVGYQITDRIRAFAGYTFLFWSNVVRPGDQVDRVLDITQIPNFPVVALPTLQARPAVPFKETDFWAQGINLGLEIRY